MASNRGGYNWEQVTGRSWDVIEEDEHGRIKALDADPSARRRRALFGLWSPFLDLVAA